jgi:siderophore synthetase component
MTVLAVGKSFVHFFHVFAFVEVPEEVVGSSSSSSTSSLSEDEEEIDEKAEDYEYKDDFERLSDDVSLLPVHQWNHDYVVESFY